MDSHAAPGASLDIAETMAALVALLGLGFALVHSGGRDHGSTEIALVLATPSLLLSRVWRTVRAAEQAVISLVALTAVSVPLVTPLGVSHAGDLGTYVYAPLLFLALRGYARDDERRRILTIGLMGLAIVESVDVLRIWVGEHDPSFQVVGTFYWHNQFGAFAAAIALVATAMVMRSQRIEDAIAWVVAPFFLAATWLSHSRGAGLAFMIGASAIVGVALWRRRWMPLVRAALAVALAIGVHAALVAAVSNHGGPGHGYSPGKDTLSSTSAFRLDAAEEAANVFAKAPLVSHGFGSLAVIGWQDKTSGTVVSPYAHSAELQALSDGGVLLGVPVALAVLLVAAAATRTVRSSGTRDGELDWLRLGSAAAAISMLLHTSMDFDSQYPVLTAMVGLLLVLALPPASVRAESSSRNRTTIGAVLVATTVAAAVVGAALLASYYRTSERLDSAAAHLRSDSARSVAIAGKALDDHAFRDPRPAAFIVEATDLGYVFDQRTLQHALHQSDEYAKVDKSFATVWHRVNAAVSEESPSSSATTRHP